MTGAESARFLAHGEITVKHHDPQKRAAALHVCMPCWLMQAATPILLGAGLIDKYEVRNPIAVWLPKIPEERFVPEYVGTAPQLPNRVSEHSTKVMKEVLELFVQLTKVLKDPTDAVPLLPLGTYVTFQYRCRTDAMAEVLLGLDGMSLAGIAEFRFALAEVLAHLLSQEGAVVQVEP